jgi:hypothetical protein
MMIERKIEFRRARPRREELPQDVARFSNVSKRVPRVARLMALAIRLDQVIRDGLVKDQAELARLGHVTRARLTQIMNLLCLAPDLQEKILFLQEIEHGRSAITEKQLRPIAAASSWKRQHEMWRKVEKNHL